MWYVSEKHGLQLEAAEESAVTAEAVAEVHTADGTNVESEWPFQVVIPLLAPIVGKLV